MRPLKKILLPVAATVLTAALLVPATGSAQSNRCKIRPNDPSCRQLEKRQEVTDRQRGITPACRASANGYSSALRKRNGANASVKSRRSALKKAKSKKGKSKAAKQLKKAKKGYAKAKTNAATLKTSYDTACAEAKVKPFG